MPSAIDDLPPPGSGVGTSGGIADLPPPPATMGDYAMGAAKGVVNALPMIGGVAGGILGTPADAVSGPMGNVVGAGIGGYLGTATKNLINSYIDPANAPQSTAATIVQPIVGGAEQAAMQGVGEAVSPYIGAGIKAVVGAGKDAAQWAGAKLLSNAGGVAPDVIKEYAQFPDRINSAPSVSALKDISDNFVGKLQSDVDAQNLTLDQANDAYKAFKADLQDQFKTAGYDARDAVTSAQQTLKDAHAARLERLSSDVYDSVNQLKSDVQSGSQKALGTLDQSDAMTPLAPVYKTIDDTVAQLQKAGTDEAQAVADKLGAYRERLSDTYGNTVAGPDAKKLIQGIDKITEYNPNAGTFDNMKNSAFKGVRSSMDQSLKATVPEYATAMEPVAADSKLLGNVTDAGFGDKQTAASVLNRISAPTQAVNRQALQGLGEKYGADFVGAADPSSLPEAAQLDRAKAAQDALRPDLVANKIDQTLASSRQASAVGEAQAGLDQTQAKLAPFRSLAPNGAGQTQAQQKLMQLAQGKNIELKDMFTQLGKLTDTDFVQAMHDQNIQAAFQKGAYNGARNAVRGGAIGLLIGGPKGAAVGATMGGMVDQWGPAISKKILDGALKVADNPTVQTISNLSIPEAAKKNMIIGLQQYLAHGQSQVAPEPVAQKQGNPNRSTATQGYAEGGVVTGDDSTPTAADKIAQAFGFPDAGPKPKPTPPPASASPGYATGGQIPGRAPYPGNNPKNDTQWIRAAKGEIVIPNSITQSKNAPAKAAKFVGETKWAQDGLEKLGLADHPLAHTLMSHPQVKKLLIQASDLKPGSKAMNNVVSQITKWGSR